MAGIIDIQVLLKEMTPVLDRADYIFSTRKCFEIDEDIAGLRPVATVLEAEGMTVIVSKTDADKQKIVYDTIFNKITLEVHSSLEAVGLTAEVSKALASCNISANIVAGYYHDHIFIPKDKAELALEALEALTKSSVVEPGADTGHAF